MLESVLWNSRKAYEIKAFSLQTRNGKHGGALVPGRTLQGSTWFYTDVFPETTTLVNMAVAQISQQKALTQDGGWGWLQKVC